MTANDTKRANAVQQAGNLLSFVNAFSYDEKAFAEAICNGHRTLQQSVMRLFMETMRQMANNSYDLRNEASVSLAKRIVAVAEDHPLPFI